MEFRRLRREDDRSGFHCGTEVLDTFFRQYAGQNQFKHQIGVTYVLADEAAVAAYVTVASHSLVLPESVRGRLPSYQIPVLLIARLAVDRRYEGQGLGRRLLQGCCELAVEQAERTGCFAVVTDAKPEAISFYRKFAFEPIADPEESGVQRHFLPLKYFEASVLERRARA